MLCFSTRQVAGGKPEDEIHLQSQCINAPAQLISEKDHVSIENLSEESLISREELVFEEDDMTKSTRRPKRQRPELLHPIPQEDSIRNAASQSEETTELTPRAATTSEGKLAKLGHKIGKNVDKTVKETMSYLKKPTPSCL
ncbi:glycosylation-dependent cell adhesion molecule 1-like [Panthera leo]|uniref:glycosylation-dependent cell adhesion molecule 1-like n=1 Tax=Panthera leo TaxID=9689 RepID=UPI001C6A7EFC|nr:glycosylation-dependent cell adhesion molecule 1-like [Panthera leo]